MLNICWRVVLVMVFALHCPFSVAPLMALAWDSDSDAPCCAHRIRHHRGMSSNMSFCLSDLLPLLTIPNDYCYALQYEAKKMKVCTRRRAHGSCTKGKRSQIHSSAGFVIAVLSIIKVYGLLLFNFKVILNHTKEGIYVIHGLSIVLFRVRHISCSNNGLYYLSRIQAVQWIRITRRVTTTKRSPYLSLDPSL